MTYNTTKKPSKQGHSKHAQQIKAEREQWHKDIEQLEINKANLGYKNVSQEKFLALTLNDISDITKLSQIVTLQDQYKKLIEHQKILWAEDNIVAKLNERHAIVHVNQTFVLTEKNNPFGGNDFSLESPQSLKYYYADTMIQCTDGRKRCAADIWFNSPNRRKYEGIDFDPTTTEHKNGFYNLWRGFARTPQKSDCSKYWDHLEHNICSNNQERYEYIRKWLAYVFQHPDQIHTALVLCGSQGVGKNSFVDPLGVLLGSHYAPLSSIHELVSNFNYHLKNAVLIHANESLWGGNKKDLGTVKAMITDKQCLIEGKGKDRIKVRNFKHVIFSSNEDWPIHLDPDDRRCVVIRVSTKRKEDHLYFQALQEQLDNGGYEALLHDLLHEDLTNFDPRKIPSNTDSFNLKLRSAESSLRYLYEALDEGGFSLSNPNFSLNNPDKEKESPAWQGEIPKDSVYQDYVQWCTNNGEKILSKALFGRDIKKIIVTTLDSRPGAKPRVWCYKFPSLQKTRKEFCEAFKEKPEQIFDTYYEE